MPLNKIPNSTTIDTFIATEGRPPECKNVNDVLKVASLIRDNFIKSGESTIGMSWYWNTAARAAIIDYWKAKRLAKKD